MVCGVGERREGWRVDAGERIAFGRRANELAETFAPLRLMSLGFAIGRTSMKKVVFGDGLKLGVAANGNTIVWHACNQNKLKQIIPLRNGSRTCGEIVRILFFRVNTTNGHVCVQMDSSNLPIQMNTMSFF